MIAEGHGKKSGGFSQAEGQGRLKAEGGNDRSSNISLCK